MKSFTIQILTILFIVFLSFNSAIAQNTYPGSGNVGIGTLTPAVLLDLNQTTQNNAYGINGQTVLQLGLFDETSTFCGVLAGFSPIGGVGNSFFGYSAGYSSGGNWNTFMGKLAGYSNYGDFNCFYGKEAGYSNGSGAGNTYLGAHCAQTITSGSDNVFIGHTTGYSAGGSQNTFIGASSGYSNSGSGNSFFGYGTGTTSTGDYNTIIGYGAVGGSISGLFNATAIGANASVTASDQMILGDAAYVGIGWSGLLLGPQRLLDIKDDGTLNPQFRISYNYGPTTIYTDFQTTSNGDLYINPSSDASGSAKNRFVGINTASPSNTLEITSTPGLSPQPAGLRFTNLNSSATPGTNPGLGVLSVNPTGDIIYVLSGGFGYCTPGPLPTLNNTSDAGIDLNGTNLLFKGTDGPNNKIFVGYDCSPSITSTTGKINVSENVGTVTTNSTAGYFENIDAGTGNIQKKAIYGITNVPSVGSGDPYPADVNIGGDFEALNADNNVAVRGIAGKSAVDYEANSIGGEFITFSSSANAKGVEAIVPIVSAFGNNMGNATGVDVIVGATPPSPPTSLHTYTGINVNVNPPAIHAPNAIYGENINAINGTSGSATVYGVKSMAIASGLGPFSSSQTSYGVYGEAEHSVRSGFKSSNVGVYGYTQGINAVINIGVEGYAPIGLRNAAGLFNGDVMCVGGHYLPSDSTLKDSIQTLNNSMSIINQLNPKSFYFKVDSFPTVNMPIGKQYGLISQQVATILPGLVDSFAIPQPLDSLGNPDSTTSIVSILALNYTGLIPFIVGGEKELNQSIDSLRTDIDSLDHTIGYGLISLTPTSISGNVGMLLNLHNIYYDGQDSIGSKIGIGYVGGDTLLPGKFNVNQSTGTTSLSTIAGYFHNGDSASQATGVQVNVDGLAGTITGATISTGNANGYNNGLNILAGNAISNDVNGIIVTTDTAMNNNNGIQVSVGFASNSNNGIIVSTGNADVNNNGILVTTDSAGSDNNGIQVTTGPSDYGSNNGIKLSIGDAYQNATGISANINGNVGYNATGADIEMTATVGGDATGANVVVTPANVSGYNVKGINSIVTDSAANSYGIYTVVTAAGNLSNGICASAIGDANYNVGANITATSATQYNIGAGIEALYGLNAIGIEVTSAYGSSTNYGAEIGASGGEFAVGSQIECGDATTGNIGENINVDASYGSYTIGANINCQDAPDNFGLAISAIGGDYSYGISVQAIYASIDNIGISTSIDHTGSGVSYGISSSAPIGTCDTVIHGCVAAAGFFNGDLAYTGNSYHVSDAMLKENVKPLSDAISVIKALQPKSYTFRTKDYPSVNMPFGSQYGLLAQDVEAIPGLQGLVKNFIVLPPPDTSRRTFSSDSIKHFNPADPKSFTNHQLPVFHDSLNHSDGKGAVEVKALDYTSFVPFLIEGMKEQQATIDSLNNRASQQQTTNQSLQNSLDSLRNQLSQLQSVVNGCCAANQRKVNAPDTTAINVVLSNTGGIILNQNDPNPFAESTTIGFNIPGTVNSAKIIFFDNLGRIINTVVINQRGPGQLDVYASNLSAGIYSYSLIADGNVVDTKKMVCTK